MQKLQNFFFLLEEEKSPNPVNTLLFKILLKQTCFPLAAPFPVLKGLLKTFLTVYTRDKENDLESSDTEDSLMGWSAKWISEEFWGLNIYMSQHISQFCLDLNSGSQL